MMSTASGTGEAAAGGNARRSVVFIITSMDYGGAETQLSYLAPQLKRRGWDVKVISMTPPVAYLERFAAADIPLLSLDMRRGKANLSAFLSTYRLLKTWRPGVVVGFMFHADLLARLAGRLAGVPIVVSGVRTSKLGGVWRRAAMRLTDALTDAVVANSSLVKDALASEGIAAPARLHAIPNGMELARFGCPRLSRQDLRAELQVPLDSFLWLAVGRLEIPKDYPGLLEAVALLKDRGQAFQLAIAGEGSLRHDLLEQIDRLGLTPDVHLLGLRQDVPDVLSAADALVLSSAWEGMPGAVMEAMAAGLPVVATRVGGVPELIEEGESGFMVEPRSPAMLAEAMLRLMTLADSQRRSLGARGRELIERDYTFDSVTTAGCALVEALLARRRRRR